MLRSPAMTVAVVGACVLALSAAGCAAPAPERPVVHIAEAAAPSPARDLARVLPSADDLATTLGAGGLMGQLVTGGPEMLLANVGESAATPPDCVGPAYGLQQVVYSAGPVRQVASRSWTGGTPEGPTASGFFGVVRFATPDDAEAFFAASADGWRRCNGQTVVLQQPDLGAQATSRITDVQVDETLISAVVMRDAGAATQRVVGVADDCIVDVEVTDGGTVRGAVDVAKLMLGNVAKS